MCRGFPGRCRMTDNAHGALRPNFAQPDLGMTETSAIAREMLRFTSKREYDAMLAEQSQLFEARWLVGQRLPLALTQSDGYDGWCGACGASTRFSYDMRADNSVDLREQMVCRTCNLNARHRVSLGLLADLHPPSERTRVYVTEQASPAFRWIQARYPEVVGSEFFTREQEPELQAHLRRLLGNQARLNFEDVTRLSFADESVDAIVSSDVLEHVPDFRAALENFHRVLAHDGDLVLTVPFLDADERSVRRAEIDANGEIRHLVEPEYHGDPVSPEGVLAFHSFGWDLLDELRECGFQSAQFCLPWQPAQAILGSLWTIHARK